MSHGQLLLFNHRCIAVTKGDMKLEKFELNEKRRDFIARYLLALSVASSISSVTLFFNQGLDIYAIILALSAVTFFGIGYLITGNGGKNDRT